MEENQILTKKCMVCGEEFKTKKGGDYFCVKVTSGVFGVHSHVNVICHECQLKQIENLMLMTSYPKDYKLTIPGIKED